MGFDHSIPVRVCYLVILLFERGPSLGLLPGLDSAARDVEMCRIRRAKGTLPITLSWEMRGG